MTALDSSLTLTEARTLTAFLAPLVGLVVLSARLWRGAYRVTFRINQSIPQTVSGSTFVDVCAQLQGAYDALTPDSITDAAHAATQGQEAA